MDVPPPPVCGDVLPVVRFEACGDKICITVEAGEALLLREELRETCQAMWQKWAEAVCKSEHIRCGGEK